MRSIRSLRLVLGDDKLSHCDEVKGIYPSVLAEVAGLPVSKLCILVAEQILLQSYEVCRGELSVAVNVAFHGLGCLRLSAYFLVHILVHSFRPEFLHRLVALGIWVDSVCTESPGILFEEIIEVGTMDEFVSVLIIELVHHCVIVADVVTNVIVR